MFSRVCAKAPSGRTAMVVAAQRERASALFVADDLAATNGFALSTGFLPSPVDPKPELNNAAPSVQLHYRAFLPTTGCSAPVPRISTPILAGASRLDRSLRIGGDRFPRSVQEPSSESRRLHAGCRLGRNQDTPQTRPGLTTSPRFRHRRYAFDTSSAVCLRSSP